MGHTDKVTIDLETYTRLIKTEENVCKIKKLIESTGHIGKIPLFTLLGIEVDKDELEESPLETLKKDIMRG